MGNFQKMSGQPHTNAGGVKTLPESVRQMELRTCFYVRVFKPLRAATADVSDPSGHKSKSAALMLATQKDALFDPLGKLVEHVVNGVRKIAKNHYHSCQKDPQKKTALIPSPRSGTILPSQDLAIFVGQNWLDNC